MVVSNSDFRFLIMKPYLLPIIFLNSYTKTEITVFLVCFYRSFYRSLIHDAFSGKFDLIKLELMRFLPTEAFPICSK